MNARPGIPNRATDRFRAAIAIAGIFLATCLALLLHWEMGGESAGYWYFAKLLLQGNGFVTADRSPVYTLYLMPFLWLPYPLSTQAEYAVTTFLAALALFAFLRARLGNAAATLFSVAWIPFLLQIEPKSQSIALACVCIAFALRPTGAGNGVRVSLSYALLVLAALFRPNFAVYFVLMFAYDFYLRWKERSGNVVLRSLSPLASRSCIAVATLAIVFALFPANHPWNNVWFASTDWFPKTAQSLGTTSMIGHYNWRYIEETYGSPENQDIYFTHQEAYAGATTVGGMVRANPGLFARTLLTNAKVFFPTAVFSLAIPQTSKTLVNSLIAVFAFLVLAYGAFQAATGGLMRVFVITSLFVIVATSVSYPKVRYMLPFVPLLGLSAWWWGKRLQAALWRLPLNPPANRGIAIPVLLCVLLVSSAPLSTWARLYPQTPIPDGTEAAQASLTRVSMPAAIKDLTRHAARCKGIVTNEHEFFGAFVIDPVRSRLYDIWEIPPFGRLNASSYSGLNAARVDCLFISYNLEREIGWGTNAKLRFDNYIKPYETALLAGGGTSTAIPFYGRVIESGASSRTEDSRVTLPETQTRIAK